MEKDLTTQKENKIQTMSGEINLTPDIVKKFLVNGQGNVTEQEVAMFIAMCKANKLNPFNKDAYLIKYGSQEATMIISKDVFFKRAIESPMYNGMESGIVVKTPEGQMEKREGMIYLDNEEILGAWCNVYRKDWEKPIKQEVNFKEYAGVTKTGELNKNWKTKPAVMITKVAEATALRKAFTDNLHGMYIAEEVEENKITYTRENNREPEELEDILQEEKSDISKFIDNKINKRIEDGGNIFPID